VFDPERDDDPGARPFYLRLVAVACVTVAACLALLPSITAFSSGADEGRSCVAIVDGWHADRPGLTAAERAAESTGFVGRPATRDELRALAAGDAYLTWRAGPGACIPESRHRLIRTGIALGSLAFLVAGVVIERRTRKNLRPAPADAVT